MCLEGEISRQSILNSLSRGKKASGDLIPWTVSEQVLTAHKAFFFSFTKSQHTSFFSCSANMNLLLLSLQFQDSEFAGLSGGRVVRIAVNPDYQGVRTWKSFSLRCPVFNQSVCPACNWFPTCPSDGLRLQSSPTAADVLWGQVSHHGWEHTLKSQRDHLRQQWGNVFRWKAWIPHFKCNESQNIS